MKYSAEVPYKVIQKLPDDLQEDENRRVFRAVYKEVCGNACVDMQDIHPDDDTYRKMAMYATYQQLYTKTGDPTMSIAAQALEAEAKEMAELEGVDIDRIASSRVYFVACNTRPQALLAGVMPESAPIQAPYCDTHMQAQELLRVLSEVPERQSPGRFGPDQKPMPTLPSVHNIYTVMVGPEKISMLENAAENTVLAMPPQGTINPKTVVEVDTEIWADELTPGNYITEHIAYGDKPHHAVAKRDMEVRASAMHGLQEALGRVPQQLRPQVTLGFGSTLDTCFAPDGFVMRSPFKVTYPERIMQLTIRELRGQCNAYTLQNAEAMKDAFVTEFSGDAPSVKALTEGLQRHLEAFQQTASSGDTDHIRSVRDSASQIVTIIAHERADSLTSLDKPLSPEQRQYLKAAEGLVPEQYKHEFVIRVSDQMQKGMSNEAATRLTCVAMRNELQSAGLDILADRMMNVANNASMQFELYKDAMENEEVEV